jgi:hypothetical protein
MRDQSGRPCRLFSWYDQTIIAAQKKPCKATCRCRYGRLPHDWPRSRGLAGLEVPTGAFRGASPLRQNVDGHSSLFVNFIAYATIVDEKRFRHHDEQVEDRPKFGGLLIVDVIWMHPMVLIGGILLETPFFVPPGELLRQRRERCAPLVSLDPRVSELSAG